MPCPALWCVSSHSSSPRNPVTARWLVIVLLLATYGKKLQLGDRNEQPGHARGEAAQPGLERGQSFPGPHSRQQALLRWKQTWLSRHRSAGPQLCRGCHLLPPGGHTFRCSVWGQDGIGRCRLQPVPEAQPRKDHDKGPCPGFPLLSDREVI